MHNQPEDKALAELKRRYPWPDRCPDVPAVPWVMDYGGRELIKCTVASRGLRVIVEIGVFVGGSVRQWLGASPDATVVAVDPWPQITGPHVFYDTHPVGRAHGEQLRRPDGLYDAFLATLWDERERVVPMRATGCAALTVLNEVGLRPDMIFIDADKQAAEIRLCDKLFPQAIVCGDDWLWCDGRQFPTQQPVRESARLRRRTLKVVSNTWLIDDRPWTLAERVMWLRGLRTSLVRRITAWQRARQGLDSAGNPVGKS